MPRRTAVTDAVGRVAVVTGASRGLGAGLALHFAASGMHLGLCARHRPAPTARTQPTPEGEVSSAEAPLSAAVDVTEPVAVAEFADAVVERFGRIDLWVNNAGLLGPVGPLAEVEAPQAVRAIEVNTIGVLLGSAVFARHVRCRPGRGVLVNISSGAAVTPYEGWAAYAASKAAVDQLTRVVALEEARHGLRAYALSPGLVDTDMQATIRASDEHAFPAVARFRVVAANHRFNSPGWVATHILALAFGASPSPFADEVVHRVPDEPFVPREPPQGPAG